MGVAAPKLDEKSHILFVDDDPNFLQGLRLMLRKQRDEFVLHFANSADEAIDAVSTNDFDVIVSDVTMPGKSGLHLLKTLRDTARTHNTPVVMLTGNAESGLKRRALDLGATDLLNKPVTLEDLVARLRSVLRLKAYQDELSRHNETLERKVLERTHELEQSRRDIVWRLAKAGEFRDEETGDHVIRVACFTRMLAEEMRIDRDTVRTLFLTSPLHDIGKIGIPDAILLKKDCLTQNERQVMESHCEMGAAILLEQPRGIHAFLQSSFWDDLTAGNTDADSLARSAAEIALTHHERWDGTGYPHRLAGDSIPLSGRIVALADVYDALRSTRPYKNSYSVEDAIVTIEQGVGSHFDPEIYTAFKRVQPQFEDVRKQFSR